MIALLMRAVDVEVQMGITRYCYFFSTSVNSNLFYFRELGEDFDFGRSRKEPTKVLYKDFWAKMFIQGHYQMLIVLRLRKP
ncbi:hypothetical protein RHMOL_Rhmol01G0031200 [Rhododendron molle]|uniref:Uncharacterized protein n=1 Tax=Rhododendron molle TaxID=49168 RepID=A0ACC0PY67_RHOML|nr:hypothetical protein RHMOL_Rhmol01G0031200 [Rhododendron molle]